MITSKRILKIIEIWSKSGKVRGVVVPVYENPTSSDYTKMRKASREEQNRMFRNIRFIANAKTQKFYVWDDNLAIHNDVLRMYNLSDKDPWVLLGYADAESGKPKIIDWLETNGQEDKYMEYNWSFIEKYLDLHQYKSEFQHFMGLW